jgi:hypothetical protein
MSEKLDKNYAGPDRRRHQAFVTRNTEYHFRDGVCIAVRDRGTGNFRLDHTALQRPLSGAVRFDQHGQPRPALTRPEVGDALFFGHGGPVVVTSCLTAIERPGKAIVSAYPI